MNYIEEAKKVHQEALEEQFIEACYLAKRIIGILGGKAFPNVELAYDECTAYSIERQTVRIKMPFCLTEINCIHAIAHECYHAFEFMNNPSKNHYSKEDRIIIEHKCDEYAYKYSFERDAEAFGYAFANFYIKEIVGYNFKEAIPYISQKAKEKYPELINTEKELIASYIVFRNNYLPIFQKYKNDLIKEYEAFIEE